MRVITNNKLIKKNIKIGKITTFSALGILLAGLIVTYIRKDQLIWSLIALAVGFIVSQVGMYYGSRWGRTPRPDEAIATALKGLDDKYTLYNYTSPVSHLLTGPAGLIPLIPLYSAGSISYNPEKQRYQQKGGKFIRKLSGMDSLGKPDMDALSDATAIKKLLDSQLGKENYLDPTPLLVFVNPEATVDLSGAPVPGIKADKLKDYIRKLSKSQPAPLEDIQKVTNLFVAEDIN
ncbi:MAG: hypothetical protein KBG60_06710 [Anaerolineaceae bacterium]|nr:hypothetical protein [Anaerolineaceae bacterium]